MQLPVAVEDSCAVMDNVVALLTSVMGLKSVLMAVMKPVSFKPSLHNQCVVHFQYIQFSVHLCTEQKYMQSA